MGFTSLGFDTRSQVLFCFTASISFFIAFLHSLLEDASIYVASSFALSSSTSAAFAYLGFFLIFLVILHKCGPYSTTLSSFWISSSWLGRASSDVYWCTPVRHGDFDFSGDLSLVVSSSSPSSWVISLPSSTTLSCSTLSYNFSSISFDSSRMTSWGDHQDEASSNITFLDVWHFPIVGSQHFHPFLWSS